VLHLTKWTLTIAALAGFGFALLTTTAAEAGKDEPAKPDDKPNPMAQAAEQAALAFQLADYGRANKSPAALLTAAEILVQVNPRPLKDRDPKLAEELEKQGLKPTSFDAKGLIAEARKMSPAPYVTALADAVASKLDETPRGKMGSPFVGVFTMKPMSTFGMTLPFKGREHGLVGGRIMSGQGEIRLTVADQKAGWSKTEQGNIIRVEWQQDNPGEVFIKRENLGNQYLEVMVWTN
jgi:hypothetical protein